MTQPNPRLLTATCCPGDEHQLASYLHAYGIDVSRIDAIDYQRDNVDVLPKGTNYDNKHHAFLRDGTMDSQFYGEVGIHNKLGIGENDVVMDVGANCGLFTIFAARQGAAVVACFEPEPANLAMAHLNIGYAGVGSRVVIGAAAVMPNTYMSPAVTLYINKGSNLGIHSVMERRGRSEMIVPAIRWEDAINIFQPTVIKIDIEGGEYALLRELAELPQRVRAIYCELHLTKEKWRKDYAPHIYRSFIAQGFTTVREPDVDPNSRRWDTCYLGLR